MGFMDKARRLIKGREGQVEDAAQKVLDIADEKSGGKIPDAVHDAVDKIDGKVDDNRP